MGPVDIVGSSTQYGVSNAGSGGESQKTGVILELNKLSGSKVAGSMVGQANILIIIQGHQRGKEAVTIGKSFRRKVESHEVDFQGEKIELDDVSSFDALSLKIVDEGMFSSEVISVIKIPRNHPAWQLGQPTAETGHDNAGNPDHNTKLEFTILPKVTVGWRALLHLRHADYLPDSAGDLEIRIVDPTLSLVRYILPKIPTTKTSTEATYRSAEIEKKIAIRSHVENESSMNQSQSSNSCYMPLKFELAYIESNGNKKSIGTTEIVNVHQMASSEVLTLSGNGTLAINMVLIRDTDRESRTVTGQSRVTPDMTYNGTNRLGQMGQGASKVAQQGEMASTLMDAQRNADAKFKATLKAPKRVDFRAWKNLDELFEDLGPHGLAQSEIYAHRMVRSLGVDVEADMRLRITTNNAYVGLKVKRGEDWSWGNQDGAHLSRLYKPEELIGNIVAVDKTNRICTVFWRATNMVHSHYRIGHDGKYDLEMCHADRPVPTPVVCADLSNLDSVNEIQYIPYSKIVQTNPEALNILKYSSYNEREEPRLHFRDVHPGYRKNDDYWGKTSLANQNDYFVKKCVRSECFWA